MTAMLRALLLAEKTPLPLLHPDGIRVVLAGNPNCGKTSLFNALTGAHQHVANYPGVTVERRSGRTSIGPLDVEVVDLPGTYSLSSYSLEERVAQRELLDTPDVVVVVADSTQLARNLVLLVQIIQTGANLVLCLNMADEAKAAGQELDLPKMQELLGFPVVETIGHRAKGIAELRFAIQHALASPYHSKRLTLGEDLDRALGVIRPLFPKPNNDNANQSSPNDYVAIRLLLGDPDFVDKIAQFPVGQKLIAKATQERERIEKTTGKELPVFLSEQYHGFVGGLLREVCRKGIRINVREKTDRIDDVLVHPVLGIPIFAAVMYAIFWLTFTMGEYPMGWIESGIGFLGDQISRLWPMGSTSLLRSLIVDGIIGGVGGVIVFLPNILLLFLGLAFLEDTGYLARATFLADRMMHRFGLHGKSFIPMVTGFGCSIPGIMATRSLENERDRLVTMLVLPLVSCGARLPIWMLLIPAFFPPAYRAPALWLIYAIGIGLALVLALILRKTILRGEDAPFVMELPPYRLPTWRNVVLKMSERGGIYLRKAGTTILGISILLWAATSFPRPTHYQVDAEIERGQSSFVKTSEQAEQRRATERLEYSVAGRIGKALEPAFSPLGFDWKILTAMVGAFAAKEVFVAQLGIVYSIGESKGETQALRERLAQDYSPLVGFSMMLFLLIATPCMATFAVTRRESGKTGMAFLQLGGLTGIAYLLSLLVFQVGSLFF
jgi:ferrous iron transport protein B